MKLKVTNKGGGRQIVGQSSIFPVNTNSEGICVTLNTGYGDLASTHILMLAHFSRTVALYEYR